MGNEELRFFFFILIITFPSFGFSIFKVNIDKKISKGQSVYRILERRFAIEIERNDVNYDFLVWLLSRMKKDSNPKSTEVYSKSVTRYFDKCISEKDFGSCLSKVTQEIAMQISSKFIYRKISFRLKKISKAEFGALSGLYFYYPILKGDKLYNYLLSSYNADSSVIRGREHLKALFEPTLLSDPSYIRSLSINLIKSIYLLINGDMKEVKLRCDSNLAWYSDDKFPLFSLCLVNLAKIDKANAIRVLRTNKKYGMSNPWFQLMCQFIDKSCLTTEQKVNLGRLSKRDSPFFIYLNSLNKKGNIESANQNGLGMAFLYTELSRLQK